MKVVSYRSNNRTVSSMYTIISGKSYEECLDFYINNKSKYRAKGEYLEIMLEE